MIYTIVFIVGVVAGYYLNKFIATNEAKILAEVNKVKSDL